MVAILYKAWFFTDFANLLTDASEGETHIFETNHLITGRYYEALDSTPSFSSRTKSHQYLPNVGRPLIQVRRVDKWNIALRRQPCIQNHEVLFDCLDEVGRGRRALIGIPGLDS